MCTQHTEASEVGKSNSLRIGETVHEDKVLRLNFTSQKSHILELNVRSLTS